MASIVEDKKGNFLVAFRHNGKQFTRSLDTQDRAIAEAGVARVEETLMRLKRGWLTLPEDAEPGVFIVSGGSLSAKPTPKDAPPALMTLGKLRESYEASSTKRANTLKTILIHLAHIQRILGVETPVTSVTQKEAKAYCVKRSKEKWHGREIRPYTIRKELRTFRDVWEWANGEGLVPGLPTWEISSLPLGRDRGREPFRMLDEIETRIKRGGLSAHEEADLWECLYLTGEQVRDFLDFVKSEPCAPFVYPLICFAALTGARRAEMLRSRIDDWELGEDRKVVHIRELKRDTSREFTMRTVDLHPRLVEVMRAWFADHPGGQYALCRPDGSPLTPDQATDHLNRVLGRHDKWKRLPGFHTFRHSFASILAANNEDQRTIDALMGHQTDDMRHRYQHIFPPKKRRAIDGILP